MASMEKFKERTNLVALYQVLVLQEEIVHILIALHGLTLSGLSRDMEKALYDMFRVMA